MITPILHSLVQFSGYFEKRKYEKALEQPVRTQKNNLRRILRIHKKLPWSPIFQTDELPKDLSSFPATTWKDYEPYFTKEKRLNYNQKLVTRFEPTSGSTYNRKWIPYTPEYLSEINRAANCWMSDLYSQYPEIKRGPHYWSLSWLPTELRKSMSNDDSQLFPWWKRWILSKIFLIPNEVSRVHTERAWRLATLVYLLSNPTPTFISVWSPTFLTRLLEDLVELKEDVQICINEKKWVGLEEDLKNVSFPQFNPNETVERRLQILKENLKLISCWSSASSQGFALKLKSCFSQSQLQGKGVWATEGVITIPFQGKMPLAVRSHFYEFRDIQTQKIRQLEELQIGQTVSPLLTTSSGLLRYELGDQLLVTGYFKKTPCFEFLGRPGTVDLVGEKLDYHIFYQLKLRLQKEFPEIPFWQFGYQKTPKVRYCLVISNSEKAREIQNYLQSMVEFTLQKYHHYRVARQLNQLQESCIFYFDFEQSWKIRQADIIGQTKPDDIIDMTDLLKDQS